MRRIPGVVFCGVSLMLAGCAAKRQPAAGSYRYNRVETQELLIPPGGALPSSKKEITLRLGKARLGKRRGPVCGVNAGVFQLLWKKADAQLRINTSDMVEGQRIVLSVMDDIDKFRVGLVKLEANGCLRQGEAGLLLTRIIESVALPSRFAYYLRHGTSVNIGYVDVMTPFRLKVVAPLEGMTGFETAWYSMIPRRGKGSRIALEVVERSVKGKMEPQPRASKALVTLPAGLGFYRLFFLTRRSANDHDILLLGAASMEALERNTELIRTQGEAACRALGTAEVACAQIPRDSAVSAELRVKAKDRYVYIPHHGNGGGCDAVSGRTAARGSAEILTCSAALRQDSSASRI